MVRWDLRMAHSWLNTLSATVPKAVNIFLAVGNLNCWHGIRQRKKYSITHRCVQQTDRRTCAAVGIISIAPVHKAAIQPKYTGVSAETRK